MLGQADVIDVGRGNTRNMMAIWHAAGVDRLIHQAWERGAVLAGISAGTIVWFEQCLTDSFGALAPMAGLGWLPGSCTPHYDREAKRRPTLQQAVADASLMPGLALDDGAAAHFEGTTLKPAHSPTRMPLDASEPGALQGSCIDTGGASFDSPAPQVGKGQARVLPTHFQSAG